MKTHDRFRALHVRSFVCALTLLLRSSPVPAKTLGVGPAATYQKPCEALAAASDGDIV